MAGFEPKKLALIRILQILQEYTDEAHPLTQEQLLRLLEREYGIELERKAVGRNLSLLQEAGYPIASNRDGSYLEQRTFDDAELRLLIDSVLSGRFISVNQSKSLIDRICKLSNRYFQAHVRHVHSVDNVDRTENKAVFLNMELIDAAVSGGNQIRYEYHRYGTDKRMHYSSTHTVSPYMMFIHNRQYYLLGYSERFQNTVYHRLDHMVHMEILEEPAFPMKSVPGLENGIDYEQLAYGRPYLFNDSLERIELSVEPKIIDAMIDRFGRNIHITAIPENTERVRVSLVASPTAMLFWSLQYLNYAEIISPESLRQRVRESLLYGAQTYGIPMKEEQPCP